MKNITPDKSLNLRIKSLLFAATKGAYMNTKVYAKYLVDLQRGLTGGRELAGKSYMESTESLGAYLLYYWPVSYLQVWHSVQKTKAILEYVKNIQNRPVSILDLGSGPGPATASLMDYLKNSLIDEKKIDFKLTLCDYSQRALSIAKKIISEKDRNIETFCEDFQVSDFSCLGEKKFDLIVACHSLNELWKSDKNRIKKLTNLVQNISTHLNEGGFMIFVEPALLLTSRSLIQLRNNLIKENFSVAAPCQRGSFDCPVLENENATCHAEVFWEPIEPVKSLARFAGLDRESVKMTYFIFQKAAEINAGSEENVLKGNSNVIEATVVSEGMLNKSGRVRFLLCDGEKRFAFSAKKDDAAAEKKGFFNLTRYDRIRITDPEVRENGALGFSQGTGIQKI